MLILDILVTDSVTSSFLMKTKFSILLKIAYIFWHNISMSKRSYLISLSLIGLTTQDFFESKGQWLSDSQKSVFCIVSRNERDKNILKEFIVELISKLDLNSSCCPKVLCGSQFTAAKIHSVDRPKISSCFFFFYSACFAQVLFNHHRPLYYLVSCGSHWSNFRKLTSELLRNIFQLLKFTASPVLSVAVGSTVSYEAFLRFLGKVT